MVHYTRCERLWHVVELATCTAVGLSPGERLCLLSPNTCRAKQLAVAFSIYHALRAKQGHAIETALDSDAFADVMSIAYDYGRIFASDFGCNFSPGDMAHRVAARYCAAERRGH